MSSKKNNRKKGATGKQYTTYGDRIKVTYTDGSTRVVRPSDASYNATKKAMESDIANRKLIGNKKSNTTASTALGAGKNDTSLIASAAVNDKAKEATQKRKADQAASDKTMKASERAAIVNQYAAMNAHKTAQSTAKKAPETIGYSVESGQNQFAGGLQAAPYVVAQDLLTTFKGKNASIDNVKNPLRPNHSLGDTLRAIAARQAQRQNEIQQKYGYDDFSGGQKLVADVGSGIANMAPSLFLATISGGASLAAMGITAAGSAANKALNEGASLQDASTYGIRSGAIEAGTELIGGGIPLLPSVLKGGKVAAKVGGTAGKVLGHAADIGMEGAEEAMSEALDPWNQRTSYNPDVQNATAEELARAALLGSLTSGVLKGVAGGVNLANTARQSKDITPKLVKAGQNVRQEQDNAQNEQQNFQTTQKNQIANAENAQNGIQQPINNQTINPITNQNNAPQNETSQADFPQTHQNPKDIRPILKRPTPEPTIPMEQRNFDNVKDKNVLAYQQEQEQAMQHEQQSVQEQQEPQPEGYDLSTLPEDVQNFIGTVSSKFGREVHVVKGMDHETPGMYKDGKVYLNGDNLNTLDITRLTTVHEFCHALKGTPEYESLTDIALPYIRSLSDDPNITDTDLVDWIKSTREGTKFKIKSDEEAYDELTAMFAEMAFENEEMVNKICLEKPNIAQRFIDFINDLIADYKVKKHMTKEEKQRYNYLKKARKLYVKGLQSMQYREGTQNDSRYSIDSNLKAQFDNWMQGYMNENDYFNLGDTPKSLTIFGAKTLPMVMTQDVLVKVTGGKHSIALDELSKLPDQIANPVMLFKGSVPNSFVVLTEMQDKSGKEVITAIHLKRYQNRMQVNRIASVYGKDNIVGYVNGNLKAGNLLDVDTKKAPTWFTSRGLQLPKLVQTIIDAKNNIPQNQQEGNTQTDVQYSTGRYQKLVEEIKNIKHKQKTSQFYTNTVQNSPLFIDTEKNIELQASDFQYDAVSEKESLHKAAERLENDYHGTARELQNKNMLTGEDVDAAMFFVQEGLQNGRETGVYSHAKAWVRKIQQSTTEEGRAIQALAKYSRNSPERIAVQAQRNVAKYEEKLKGGNKIAGKEFDSGKWRKVQKEGEKVQQAVEGAEKETSKILGDAIYKRILNGLDTTLSEKGKFPASRQIVNEIYQKLKEEGVPDYSQQRGQRSYSKLEYLKHAVQNKGNYIEAFENAREYMKVKYGNDPEKVTLVEDILNGGIDSVYSDKTLSDAVKEAARLYDIDLSRIVTESRGNRDAAAEVLKNYIAQFTKVSDADVKKLSEDVVKVYCDELAKQRANRVKLLTNKEQTAKAEEVALKKLEELYNLGAYGDENVSDYQGRKTENALRQIAKDLSIDFKEIIKQNKTTKDEAAAQIAKRVKTALDVPEADAKQIADNIVSEYYGTLSKYTEQRLKQLFPELSQPQLKKAGQRGWMDKILELINLGAYDNQDIVDIIKEKNKLPVLTNDDIKAIYEYTEKANQYRIYSPEWKTYMSKAQQIAADKMPKTITEKATHLKRLSMLSNFATHARNTEGNIPLAMLDIASGSVIAAPVDAAVSKIRGSQRTVSANPHLTATVKGFGSGVADTVRDIKNNADTYRMGDENTTQYEMPRGRVFDNAFLNGIDKAINYALMFGDRPFFEMHYARRLKELEDLGWDITSADAKGDAYNHALEMVFQNDSDMSRGATGFRAALNNLLTIGPFALGDFAIPFARTPANIADKLLEYSPIGMAKAVAQIGMSYTNAFDQRLFCSRIAHSLTGTSIMALAYVLAENGIITGSSDDDKDKQKAMEAAGWKAYSFKIGKKYYPYQNIQPIGMMLAIGADINKEMKSVDSLDDIAAVIGLGIKGGANCFFNMSFFKSLTDLAGGYGDTASNIANTMMNFPTQFAPALGNAVAKTIDPYQRETYDSDPLKQMLNKFVAKVPGASRTLPKRLNVYGEEMLQNQGRDIGNRAFENIIAPTPASRTQSKPVNDELLRLNKATGDNTMFFSMPAKKEDFGEGQEVKLTADEWLNYINNANGKAAKQVETMLGTEDYKALDDGQKIKTINNIKKLANYQAKKIIAESHGIEWSNDDLEKVLDDISENKITPAEYYSQKSLVGDSITGTYSEVKRQMKICDKMGMDYEAYHTASTYLNKLRNSTDENGKTIKGNAAKDKKFAALKKWVEEGDVTEEQAWYLWTEEYNSNNRKNDDGYMHWRDCPYQWIIDNKEYEKAMEAEKKKNVE